MSALPGSISKTQGGQSTPTVGISPIVALAVPPADDLTPGQREALAAMTEAERTQLAAMAPSRRAGLLAPFATGFEPRFFETITRRELKPPKFLARPAPVEPTTPNLVAAVADGDVRYVPALAEALCRDFGGAGDRRRWGAIHALSQQLLTQAVTPEDLLDAHRQAMGPKAENRGAVFTHALRRLGWTPEARTGAQHTTGGLR